jgi:hypothetical protein
VLLASLAVQARGAWLEKHAERVSRFGKTLELSLGALLLCASIAINGLGATDRNTQLWNVRPSNIDLHPERNWDWRQPQFLAGLVRPPLPANIPVAPFDRIDFTTPLSAAYLWYGWSQAEPMFRWTEAKEAALAFRLNAIKDLQLTAKLQAFVIPNRHPEQRLSVALNGKPIGKFSFSDERAHEITLALSSNLLRQSNVVELFLPDAVSPKSLGVSEDTRSLGIAVYWIQFSPKAASYLPPTYNGETLLSSAQPR